MPLKKSNKKKVVAKRPVSGKAPRKASSAPSKRTSPARGPLAPERVSAILKALDEAYPEAICALSHRSPCELIIGTILSAK
jgi:endonuclease-3